jgi:hypothetical protein
MQIALVQSPVWSNTSDDRYSAARTGGYPNFLSDPQKSRLERIRQAQLLFDGKHEQYFLAENRTQFDFEQMDVGGVTIKPYSTFNVLGLTSLKFADLMFGQAPALRVDDKIQQGFLDELVKRCHLHSFLHACATDCSYEAESFIEAAIINGGVYLRQIRADEIFPEGEIGPDWQFASYVAYRIANVGTGESPVWVMLEVRYLVGSIERQLWQLADDGTRRGQVDLAQWPLPAGTAPLPPVTQTGIGRNTITYVPNLMVRGTATSDYDGAINLQDKLNAKDTQVDVILAKYASPAWAVPQEMADETGSLQARRKLFFYHDPTRIPKDLARQLQIDSAIADCKRTLNNLLIRMEMSAVLLGLKEGAAPDAWRKVKLESFNAIKKAERKSAFWTAGATRAIEVAQDLENTLPGVRYDRWPIAVEIRDGIPVDELDLAQKHATLRGAGLISKRGAITERLGDGAAAEAELTELDEEAAAATPSVFLGGSEVNDQSPSPNDQGMTNDE